MTRTIIPDYWFDTAVKDYDVSQEQINTFVNDLAKEFDSNWQPVSGGYQLDISDINKGIAYAEDDIPARIQNWLDTL